MKFFNFSIFQSFNRNSGFTVIEFIITTAIIAVLTSALFASDYSLREQYILFQEQNRLYNVFNETKNLALAAFARDPETVCGYGVSFQKPRNVIIYRNYKNTGADCASSGAGHNFYYSTNTWGGDDIIDEKSNLVLSGTSYSFQLNPVVEFDFSAVSAVGSSVDRIDVLFIAPKPTVFITNGTDNMTYVEIELSLKSIKNGSASAIKIKINDFGQISMEYKII